MITAEGVVQREPFFHFIIFHLSVSSTHYSFLFFLSLAARRPGFGVHVTHPTLATHATHASTPVSGTVQVQATRGIAFTAYRTRAGSASIQV